MSVIELSDLHAELVARTDVTQRLAEKNLDAGREANWHHYAGRAQGFREAARMVATLIGEVEE